jgi:hypothetical protein
MMLNNKERKVLIIGILALSVAVVTFGLLESTGAFKNSTYNLGGSIVGFLAAAYLLNKIYGPESGGIPRRDLKGATYISEESLKILDLHNHQEIAEHEKEDKPRNKVVLIDHFKIRKRKEATSINFKYATRGYGMEGTCVSHPQTFNWIETTNKAARPGEDLHLEKRYEIQLDLEGLAVDEAVYVHNAVTYISAFEGKEKEWFHSHVNIPTKSLTLILLFPKSKPCKKIIGNYKIGTNPFVEVPKQKGTPIRVQDGKIVYWRITPPQLGVAYQLEWEW